MFNVLNIGKSGLNSMQTKMDSIANNLANVNTNGYKTKDVSFEELLYNQEINAGSNSGLGKIDYAQGSLVTSPLPYNMAIVGNGFFGVVDENNNLMLTRNGGFHVNEDNSISDDNGYPLVIEYEVPFEEWTSTNVSIAPDGTINAMDEERTLLGKVVLFQPENLDSLASLGESRYLPSDNIALYDSLERPDLFGDIQQYFLESSNVDVTKSMADMITTQRAYSLNAKAVETTDEIMKVINGIKR